MTFEFLIFYRNMPNTNIREIVADILIRALQANYDEVDADEVQQMIVLRNERLGEEIINDAGNTILNVLLCLGIELSDETDKSRIAIEEFAEALAETDPIYHVVKFEDPILKADLANWAEEIFDLEMKLRRVLTLIYLYAYQDGDPYNLLCDESTEPMGKKDLKIEDIKKSLENEFFYLTFSQYVSLNRRPEIKQVKALLETISNSETYDAFRTELNRVPVQHEDDAVFLAGLKERMDPIEKMRNCVAHNRRPSQTVVNNYETVRPLLDNLLDDYLNQWLWRETHENESLDDEGDNEFSPEQEDIPNSEVVETESPSNDQENNPSVEIEELPGDASISEVAEVEDA